MVCLLQHQGKFDFLLSVDDFAGLILKILKIWYNNSSYAR